LSGVFRLRFSKVIAITFARDFKASFHMYPALFTSLLFLGFLGFHFIYKALFLKS
jgi:hypothetical protein